MVQGVLSNVSIHDAKPGDRTQWKMDSLSQAMPSLDIAHSRVHSGISFITWFTDISLANNDTIILAFKTPIGTKRIHIISEFETLTGGDLNLWEGPTWTTNTGVLNAIINRKREAVMESSSILEDLTATPTFTATDNILSNVTGLNTGVATLIQSFFAFGNQQKAGGSSRDKDEIILKPNTQYAYVFTSDGANNKAQVVFEWYEFTDR